MALSASASVFLKCQITLLYWFPTWQSRDFQSSSHCHYDVLVCSYCISALLLSSPHESHIVSTIWIQNKRWSGIQMGVKGNHLWAVCCMDLTESRMLGWKESLKALFLSILPSCLSSGECSQFLLSYSVTFNPWRTHSATVLGQLATISPFAQPSYQDQHFWLL